ncbi:MAG: hypothetical protein ACI8W9_000947, partial [Psychromonas sp.]
FQAVWLDKVHTHDTSRCKVSNTNCAKMLGIKLNYSYST